MAKRDSDMEAHYDREKTSGLIKRIVRVGEHEEFSNSEWSAVRSAAATSLAALDNWYANCGDSARANWWAAKSSTYREDLRQAILGLS